MCDVSSPQEISHRLEAWHALAPYLDVIYCHQVDQMRSTGMKAHVNHPACQQFFLCSFFTLIYLYFKGVFFLHFFNGNIQTDILDCVIPMGNTHFECDHVFIDNKEVWLPRKTRPA